MSASQSRNRTRVLYNADCPVCSFEIDHYRARADRDNLDIAFDDLNGPDLAEWNLSEDQAARRLHVLRDGKVLSGFPAFRALWSEMPHMRWLAALTGLPGLRHGLSWAYDHIGAPVLFRMHRRRVARRKE